MLTSLHVCYTHSIDSEHDDTIRSHYPYPAAQYW